MDTRKIINDLLLVVQSLNVGNSTVFHNREEKKWIEYEIYSPENIPVITMRYSMSENNVATRRKNEELTEKNKALVEKVFNETINEGPSTSGIIKEKVQKIFPIQNKEEDSGHFINDKIKNNWTKIKTRSTGERKNDSNAAEALEETSMIQIDTEVNSKLIPSKGGSGKDDAIAEIICETTMNKEGNHRKVKKYITVKKQFKCRFCEKVFKRKDYRRKHERIHRGERSHTCAECNKSFYTSTHLNQHLKIHTREELFICDQCGKSFSRLRTLNRHTTIIHSNHRPFPCEWCENSFKMKVHLKRHIWIHTGEKPYNCKWCEKSFTRRFNLKRHIRIHTGEKPYNCEYCNKPFGDKRRLIYHLRLHTGEKPYTCVYCGKTFVSSSRRFRHEKRSHKGKI